MQDQPPCGICKKNPQTQTMQVTEDTWLDICDVCAAKNSDKVVIPIQVESNDY